MKRAALDDSGTTAPQFTFSMRLLSRVTLPLRARALPSMEAPEFRVMLVRARICPLKSVSVPRVAELPICQKTLHPTPAAKEEKTLELEAVVRVLPI